MRPHARVEIAVRPLEAIAGEAGPELQSALREEARRSFDLERDLLIRATLFRLEKHDHVLLLNLHHIICDEWSLRVLLRDLANFYERLTGGSPEPLPELLIQYPDFALWQRDWLQGAVLIRQLNYWKQCITAGGPVLEWPAREAPASSEYSYSGRRRTLVLPAPLTEQLRELSRRERVTLFMSLLAGFKALLHRYTGQEEIAVGSPISGRTRAETEELIGFFVNTLVLRTGLSGDPTFIDLLRRVRKTTLGAYDHQDLPFEKLVEELHPERSRSHTPLFQAAFALEEPAEELLRFPD